MSEITLSAYYNDKKNNHRTRANILMLLLMPFVYIMFLGCPGRYIGGFIMTFSYFVPLVYFILFGFFAFKPDRVRKRRIKRLTSSLWQALIVFAVMIVINTIVSLVYLSYAQTAENLLRYLDSLKHMNLDSYTQTADNVVDFINSLKHTTLDSYTQTANNVFGFGYSVKHTIFDFLVLNVWPFKVGSGIWFVHSLVYAYLFFMLIEKLRLNKYYVPILIVLYIALLATGEFAKFCGFPILSYQYIPGGAFTRAIPYMLIGMLLRKYVDKLPKIPQYAYILAFLAGAFAVVLELAILKYIGKYVYFGHTIGYAIMAISLCCFTLAKPAKNKAKPGLLAKYARKYTIRLYILCQPVAILTWTISLLCSIRFKNPLIYAYTKSYSFAISFVISLIITILISLIKKLFVIISLRFSKRKFMKFIYKILTFDPAKNT